VGRGAILGLARDLPESRRIVDALRARGVAIAAVWNQTWSGKARTFVGEQVLWNWVQSPTHHPGWRAFVDGLAKDGIRTLCYVNPMLVDPPAEARAPRNLFAEAVRDGHLVRRPDGAPYLLRVTAFDVGLLDLANPAARTWMKRVMREEMIEAGGCSGWMADFAEALPFDARLAGGVDGAAYHNRYPVEWARLQREAIEEAGRLGDALVWNRSGSTRTPAHALLLWEGDQLTTWDKYDGLVSALHGLLGGGMSGIALNHSDTGGYTSLSLHGVAGYEREAELLQRWAEMNAFTAVLRTHEGNQPGVNAQVYSSPALMDHFARMTRVYRALAPYRETLLGEAATRGWPVVRHLWLHHPDDATAQVTDDEFLLGSEILVAPIKNKCWTWPYCPYDKEVYLPRGEWVHLWTGRVHGSVAGGRTATVKAPIGEPAVFYRRGSPVGAQLVARLRAEGIAAADAP
jgi:alpha-glucosidase